MMKKILGIVVLSLLLGGNAFAKTGKGELKLSKYTMETLMMYMYGRGNPDYFAGAHKKNKPMLMTVSANGKSSHYYYCPYATCETGNYVYISIKSCEKTSNGSPCYLFAKQRKIVWKNSINKKGTRLKKKILEDPYNVAKAIQDLGFYDQDISKLPGIDFKTGALDENKTITGKTDNFDYPSLIASLTPTHKSGWKDYVTGGKEKYKAWVMAKRKDKDMAWSFEANNISWDDVIKKAFNRCNEYINNKPKSFPDKAICILYYKGTTPTSDDEKIKTAINYYGESKANAFFKKYGYVLNDIKSLENEQQQDSSIDIVEKLKDLNSLLESGVISAEEFEKAKKKLLN